MEFYGQNDNQVSEGDYLNNSVVQEASPLKIDLDDNKFIEVLDNLITDSRRYFEGKRLKERRDKNEEYYLGLQVYNLEKDNKLKPYQARYLDNVIYEAVKTLKAIAVSRVPDLLVKGGNDTEESRSIADELTEVLNSRMRKREIRITLGRAYKHRQIYFVGVIKPLWDSEMGEHGDYKYECVHPRNIDVDHTATSNNADEMSWIAHHYDMTVKEILMKWPNKKEELYNEMRWNEDSRSEEKKLASKLKITEVWFTWYEKEGDEWTKIDGVAWKYRKVVFDKIKNPYWDWKGETFTFSYDNETGKQRVNQDMLRQSLLTGQPLQGLSAEKVYHNHFKYPKKPFIFMGYDQLGMQPYDETSIIEQSIFLQDNVNKRGQQITELSALAKGKNVFSTDSGLKASDIENLDMGNPDQDLLINGRLSDVFSHIPGNQPTAALFQEQDLNRSRLFAKMGTNSALRGQRSGEDTATQTQLFKESDYTVIDDEVEDTINAAAEQMADWAMQFMKLFYTEEHLVKLKGKDGSIIFSKLDRDLIEDGMEVEVSASAVDKLKRKREAFELAGMGMIDPVSFFRDIEASDPEGRAEKLFLFQAQPMMYFQQFVKQNSLQDMTQQLQQAPLPGQPMEAGTPPTEMPPQQQPFQQPERPQAPQNLGLGS